MSQVDILEKAISEYNSYLGSSIDLITALSGSLNLTSAPIPFTFRIFQNLTKIRMKFAVPVTLTESILG